MPIETPGSAETIAPVIGLILIVLGAVKCFFGYRLFLFILALVGFITGASVGGGAGYGASVNGVVAVFTALLGGILGAGLIFACYAIGVFLLGAIGGAALGAFLFVAFGNQPEPAVLLILAVIGGCLALAFQVFVIVLTTAFGGAATIIFGFIALFSGTLDSSQIDRLLSQSGDLALAAILGWLAIGVAGTIYQCLHLPKEGTGRYPQQAGSTASHSGKESASVMAGAQNYAVFHGQGDEGASLTNLVPPPLPQDANDKQNQGSPG